MLTWFPFRGRSKGAPIQVVVGVERYATGRSRFEARPVSMTVRGKEIPFQADEFVAYGWTRRAARKRCLAKVLPYVQKRAKDLKD